MQSGRKSVLESNALQPALPCGAGGFSAPRRSTLSRLGFLHSRVAASLAVALVLLTGCSGSDAPTPPKEPDLKEIPTTDTALSADTSEIELMYRGKKYFESRVFGEAKKAFQSITSNYPLGPYAEFAAVKYADTVFEQQEYPAAAALYEELYKNHPGAEFAPYALFRAGRSYQLAQRGVGRDDTSLQKAAKLFDELLQKHPDSFFASASKTYRDQAHKELAEYEDGIAAFYRKRNKSQAAEARERAYQEKWQPILATSAQQNQTEALEQRAALEKIAANLEPAAPRRGASPATPAVVSGAVIAGKATSTPTIKSTGAATRFVSKLECGGAIGPFLTLFLDKELPGDMQLEVRNASDSNGAPYAEIKLPNTAAQPEDRQCKDGIRAVISAAGELRIYPPHELSLVTLGNPARLMVVVNH